jgi:multisubunit Na+/H+ antiporter MnhF subunit
LRPASPGKLLAVLLLGPVVWVVALVVLAVVVREGDAVEVALLVALASFVIAVAYLSPQRILRMRRERRQ